MQFIVILVIIVFQKGWMLMSDIWVISDTHFNHNKDFIFGGQRGFSSVYEMNEALIENWNKVVKPDDIVYHLGDMMLGQLEDGLKIIKQLKGRIYLAYGNHDTSSRLEAFNHIYNIEDIQFGYRLKAGKKTLLLTHYPTLTGNYDASKTYSIHGHTHSPNKFDKNHELTYNVSCEAINCTPINLEQILFEIRQWAKIIN